jgi:hypothetical protein
MPSIPTWLLHLLKAVGSALVVFAIWFVASRTWQGNKYIAPRATVLCFVISLYAAFHIFKFVSTLLAANRSPHA